MERLKKTKRKHHLQEILSSDEPDNSRGQAKHRCSQPPSKALQPASDHFAGVRSHHSLAREKRRKSKNKRNRRRERRHQSQTGQNESKIYAAEKSEFRRHVRRAQEITSKSKAHHPVTGPSAPALITQNRLTRKLGIYNQGKSSNKVVRDVSAIPESIQSRVNEDIKKIIGCRPLDRPCSITTLSHDPLLEDANILSHHTNSPYDDPQQLQHLLESTHLHRTPPSSSNGVPAEITTLSKSCDFSSGSSFSAISGVQELPESPPLEELSAQFAEGLNLERYFPGQDYLAEIQSDLRKLADLNSPSLLVEKRTPRRVGNRKSLSSVRRKLEDSFRKVKCPGDHRRLMDTRTPSRSGSSSFCLQQTPTLCSGSSQNPWVQGDNQTENAASKNQGRAEQSSLRKFKEYIGSHRDKVDVMVQTHTERPKGSGKTKEHPCSNVGKKLNDPCDRVGRACHSHISQGQISGSSRHSVPKEKNTGSNSDNSNLWEACPSPWIKCCENRQHRVSDVTSHRTRGSTTTRGYCASNERVGMNINNGEVSRDNGREHADARRSDHCMLCIGNHKQPSSQQVEAHTKQTTSMTSEPGSRHHRHLRNSCYRQSAASSQVWERDKEHLSRGEEKENFEKLTNEEVFSDDMMDGIQFLKRAETSDGIWFSGPKRDAKEGYHGSHRVATDKSEPHQRFTAGSSGTKYGLSKENGEKFQRGKDTWETTHDESMNRMQGLYKESGMSYSAQHSRNDNREEHLPVLSYRHPLSPLSNYQPSPVNRSRRRRPAKWITMTDSSETDDDTLPYWTSDLPLPPPVLLVPDTPKMYPQKMF